VFWPKSSIGRMNIRSNEYSFLCLLNRLAGVFASPIPVVMKLPLPKFSGDGFQQNRKYRCEPQKL